MRVKQARIIELRQIFRKYGTKESLVQRCKQWGVSAPTIANYIQQVHDDLEKVEIKKRRIIIAQRMSEGEKRKGGAIAPPLKKESKKPLGSNTPKGLSKEKESKYQEEEYINTDNDPHSVEKITENNSVAIDDEEQVIEDTEKIVGLVNEGRSEDAMMKHDIIMEQKVLNSLRNGEIQ